MIGRRRFLAARGIAAQGPGVLPARTTQFVRDALNRWSPIIKTIGLRTD